MQMIWKIFKENKRGEEDMESLQLYLEKLYDWSQYSLLKFHPDKCVILRIGTNQKKLATNPYYNMDATRLKIVEHEKGFHDISPTDISPKTTRNKHTKNAALMA